MKIELTDILQACGKSAMKFGNNLKNAQTPIEIETICQQILITSVIVEILSNLKNDLEERERYKVL